MGAVVALLSRNIIIDGSDGADGIFGGRVLIASTIEKEGGDSFYRAGHGQFSYVQFKSMGQFGYNADDDPRFQLAFYNIDPTAGPNRLQLGWPRYALTRELAHKMGQRISNKIFGSHSLKNDTFFIFSSGDFITDKNKIAD